MNSANAISALVVGVVSALAGRFLFDQTWVYAIVTGLVVAVVFFAYRVAMARRSTT